MDYSRPRRHLQSKSPARPRMWLRPRLALEVLQRFDFPADGVVDHFADTTHRRFLEKIVMHAVNCDVVKNTINIRAPLLTLGARGSTSWLAVKYVTLPPYRLSIGSCPRCVLLMETSTTLSKVSISIEPSGFCSARKAEWHANRLLDAVANSSGAIPASESIAPKTTFSVTLSLLSHSKGTRGSSKITSPTSYPLAPVRKPAQMRRGRRKTIPANGMDLAADVSESAFYSPRPLPTRIWRTVLHPQCHVPECPSRKFQAGG